MNMICDNDTRHISIRTKSWRSWISIRCFHTLWTISECRTSNELQQQLTPIIKRQNTIESFFITTQMLTAFLKRIKICHKKSSNKYKQSGIKNTDEQTTAKGLEFWRVVWNIDPSRIIKKTWILLNDVVSTVMKYCDFLEFQKQWSDWVNDEKHWTSDRLKEYLQNVLSSH